MEAEALVWKDVAIGGGVFLIGIIGALVRGIWNRLIQRIERIEDGLQSNGMDMHDKTGVFVRRQRRGERG